MFIDTHNFKALSLDSLSEAVKAFDRATGSTPRHLLVSKTDQILGEELVEGGDILVSYIAALPLGAWLLCSDKAIFIGGEQEGKHTIVMWKA